MRARAWCAADIAKQYSTLQRSCTTISPALNLTCPLRRKKRHRDSSKAHLTLRQNLLSPRTGISILVASIRPIPRQKQPLKLQLKSNLNPAYTLTVMANVPPLIMKPAMPVPLSQALSRKRARGIRSRYASFTLTNLLALYPLTNHPRFHLNPPIPSPKRPKLFLRMIWTKHLPCRPKRSAPGRGPSAVRCC